MKKPIDSFIKSLAAYRRPDVFNPWRDTCELDAKVAGRRLNGPGLRRALLASYLNVSQPRLILVGECGTRQGSRYTGIPMTSEYLVAHNRIPRVKLEGSITTSKQMLHEPAYSAIWQVLHQMGVADRTLTWDIVPWHTTRGQALGNRPPTPEEYRDGMRMLEVILSWYPNVPVVALGDKALHLIHSAGRSAEMVKNPARGGAEEFMQGIRTVIERILNPSYVPEPVTAGGRNKAESAIRRTTARRNQQPQKAARRKSVGPRR